MNPFVIVFIILCGCIIFPSMVICCVSSHRKSLSQPRDLEKGNIGTKDGGLVVLSGNDATADSGSGDYNGCCCGGGGDGGGGGGGDGGGGSGGCGG